MERERDLQRYQLPGKLGDSLPDEKKWRNGCNRPRNTKYGFDDQMAMEITKREARDVGFISLFITWH